MIRTGVLMFHAHRCLKRCLRLGRARLGATVDIPIVPACRVHEAFGKHSGDIGIVRIFSMQCTHGIEIGKVAFALIGNGVFIVQNEQGIDHVLLERAAIVR